MRLNLQLGLGKWHVALLAFLVAYAVLIILNMPGIPMQWDEVNHFNGALLLLRGEFWPYLVINSFYPPLYNLVTTGFFAVLGASLLTGRLVALFFSVLSIFLVYRIGKEMSGEKTALLSAAFFGVMPGIVWLSSVAMIETMLLFVFLVCMLFFFRWLKTGRDRDFTFCIAAFVLGVLVKYQIIVFVPIIMILGVLFLGRRSELKVQFGRFVRSRRLWVGVALVVLGVVALVGLYVSKLLEAWIYALQVGNVGQSLYSQRFPMPIFYIYEMTAPYHNVHPVSLVLYAVSFVGLGYLALRRRPQDKFLLVWFLAVFVVFTLIPNKQWRYVTPLFPVLAISASTLIASAVGWCVKTWQSTSTLSMRKYVLKASAVALIALTLVVVGFSCNDAYTWAGQGQPQIPIPQAVDYAASITQPGRSILVLCPYNLFNNDMVWFYLNKEEPSHIPVYQYPQLAVDAYQPQFSIAELLSFCRANQTQTLLLYEYGGNIRYFDSDLTQHAVFTMLNSTGSFTLLNTFGEAPSRIFVLSFQ
jgi:4-amino-4-deoxy-L-arabinose transferase-like glycosyltransferase